MKRQGITFAFSGAGIRNDDLRVLLKQSYDADLRDHGNWKVDRALSGQRVQVYHNPRTGETVVAHRGTQGMQDVGTDMQLFFGYKKGARYQHADKVQRQAEAKYGTEGMTTIGHSLGASIASDVGKNSSVVTLNKPVTVIDQYTAQKQREFNIRTQNDPFSVLQRYDEPEKQNHIIPSYSINPVTEHSTDTLSRVNKNKYWGV